MTQRINFKFPAPDPEGVEGDIALAIFASECIYGRPKTRIEVSYWLPDDGRRAVFEVRGPAGDTALRVLVGLFGARFGERGFTIDRVPREALGTAAARKERRQ